MATAGTVTLTGVTATVVMATAVTAIAVAATVVTATAATETAVTATAVKATAGRKCPYIIIVERYVGGSWGLNTDMTNYIYLYEVKNSMH